MFFFVRSYRLSLAMNTKKVTEIMESCFSSNHVYAIIFNNFPPS